MNSTNYRDQLLSLLPPGKAFARTSTSGVGRMMHGLAVESERVEERAKDLMQESVASNCDELLAEWEADYGLLPTGTTSQRKAALAAKVIDVGQQYSEYFEEIITKYGFNSDIYQFKPAWAGTMVAGDACGDQDVLFYWLVDVLDSTTVDDMSAMMAEINRLRPGHTQVFFDYPNSVPALPKITLESYLSSDIDNQILPIVFEYLRDDLDIEGIAGSNTLYITDDSDTVKEDELKGCFVVHKSKIYEIISNTASAGTDVNATIIGIVTEGFKSQRKLLYSKYYTGVMGEQDFRTYGTSLSVIPSEAIAENQLAGGVIYYDDLDEGPQSVTITGNDAISKYGSGNIYFSNRYIGYIGNLTTFYISGLKADPFFTSLKNKGETELIASPSNIFLMEYCEVSILTIAGASFSENELAGRTVNMFKLGKLIYSRVIVRNAPENTAMTGTSVGTINAQGAGTFIVTYADNNGAEDDGLVGTVVSGNDYIEIQNAERALTIDELAGYLFAADVYGWVNVIPDPTFGGRAGPGSNVITGLYTTLPVAKNQLCGMRISGVYDDDGTPFSFIIMSNTMKDSSINCFSVTIYGTTSATKAIDDQGYVIDEWAPTGQVQYTITGNDAIIDGIFDSGFSKGFAKT